MGSKNIVCYKRHVIWGQNELTVKLLQDIWGNKGCLLNCDKLYGVNKDCLLQ